MRKGKVSIKLLIKNIIIESKMRIIKAFVQKSFYDEISFFTKASLAERSDCAAKSSLFRLDLHYLDKKLYTKENKENLIKIARKKIKEYCDINAELINWGKNILKLAEIGEDFKAEPTDSNCDPEQLELLIRSRRSIRSFKEDPLPASFSTKIIECALWAPTGCNRQNLAFMPVTDKNQIKTCQKYAGEPGAFVQQAPYSIIVLADCRTYAFPVHRHQVYLEAGAAIQNMLLYATSQKIGSIWLNWAASGKKLKEFQKLFKISDYMLPAAYVLFGYTNNQCKLIPVRKTIEESIINNENK